MEKHLVITIGDSFYLALSKGPINQYHILILSVTHIQSTALLSEADWHELEKFKSGLREFFASMYNCLVDECKNNHFAHKQTNTKN